MVGRWQPQDPVSLTKNGVGRARFVTVMTDDSKDSGVDKCRGMWHARCLLIRNCCDAGQVGHCAAVNCKSNTGSGKATAIAPSNHHHRRFTAHSTDMGSLVWGYARFSPPTADRSARYTLCITHCALRGLCSESASSFARSMHVRHNIE